MDGLKPDYLTFSELLNNRLFRIPNFQRPYSWESKQRKDLFGDIVNAFNKNTEHFMATIVCVKTTEKERIGSDELVIFEVVDGQQRLTTLIILLKAIQSIGLDKRKTDEARESDRLLNDLLIRGSRQLILLQTNHDEAKVFERYLKEGKKPDAEDRTSILSVKKIYDAISECENFVKEWKKNGQIVELLAIVKKQDWFSVLRIEHRKDCLYCI